MRYVITMVCQDFLVKMENDGMPTFLTIVDYKDSDGGHIRYNRFKAKTSNDAMSKAECYHEVSPAARDVWDVEITVQEDGGEPVKEGVDYDIE